MTKVFRVLTYFHNQNPFKTTSSEIFLTPDRPVGILFPCLGANAKNRRHEIIWFRPPPGS